MRGEHSGAGKLPRSARAALDADPPFPLIGASVYFACSDSKRNKREILNKSNFGISPKRQILILKIGAQPLK